MATAHLHDVLRPLPGPGGIIDSGQTVDVSGWHPRRVNQLVERRYLRPAPAQAAPVAQAAPPVEPSTPTDPPAQTAKPKGKE